MAAKSKLIVALALTLGVVIVIGIIKIQPEPTSPDRTARVDLTSHAEPVDSIETVTQLTDATKKEADLVAVEVDGHTYFIHKSSAESFRRQLVHARPIVQERELGPVYRKTPDTPLFDTFSLRTPPIEIQAFGALQDMRIHQTNRPRTILHDGSYFLTDDKPGKWAPVDMPWAPKEQKIK